MFADAFCVLGTAQWDKGLALLDTQICQKYSRIWFVFTATITERVG